MPRRPTVLLEKEGTFYKVFKVWFGSDGSYYVTAPYHSHGTAFLCKVTVNYDVGAQQFVPMDEFPLTADLDDDEQRLKLSHHPDGFCQFSGQGIKSGRDDFGNPKGVGVFTAPLKEVGAGPAFAVGVHQIDHFRTVTEPSDEDVVIHAQTVLGLRDHDDFVFEGHYFQPDFRRFVYDASSGNQYISVPHPTGVLLRLRVIESDCDRVDYPGFIGIDCYRTAMKLPGPGFTLNGPGEKGRVNDKGERIADVLACHCPKPEGFPVDRNMNFVQSPRDNTGPAD